MSPDDGAPPEDVESPDGDRTFVPAGAPSRVPPAAGISPPATPPPAVSHASPPSGPPGPEATIDFSERAPRIPGVTLVGVIGGGGMGVVYRGRQSYLDREVAVKLLATGRRGADFDKRFRREARILAGLTHPNIVACYEGGVTADGGCYLVMELIDGPSLRLWIDEHGAVPLGHALSLCRDMALALAHAHEAGVIHRDVKPDNVLLQRDERAPAGHPFPFRAKLADLGLARPQSDAPDEMNLTVPGAVMGTPATMAPEQFDDPDRVDYRADIYGLGCVLYHAVTGAVAYPQRTLSETFSRKMQGRPPDPRAVRPDLPSGISDLTMRMLARQKEERPQSYAEVIERCEALLRAPARPVASKRRVGKFVGAALGAGVLAAGGFLLLRDSPRDPGRSSPGPVDPVVPPRVPLAVAIDEPGPAEEGQRVTLRSNVTAPEGARVAYLWTQTGDASAPRVTLDDPKSPRPVFEVPGAAADYELAFSLAVRDEERGERASAETRVRVKVKETIAPPKPSPLALLVEAPESAREGETVVLRAKASGTDGARLTYRWSQEGDGSAPRVTLNGSETPEPTFAAPVADADYEVVCSASVKDDSGRESPPQRATVRVKVNRPPVIDDLRFSPPRAGAGDRIVVMAEVSDPEGGEIGGVWKQVGGPAVELRDATPREAWFVAPERDEAYTVELRLAARDGSKETVSKTLVIAISADPALAPLPKGRPQMLFTRDARGEFSGFQTEPAFGYFSPERNDAGDAIEETMVVESARETSIRRWRLPRGPWRLTGELELHAASVARASAGVFLESPESGVANRFVGLAVEVGADGKPRYEASSNDPGSADRIPLPFADPVLKFALVWDGKTLKLEAPPGIDFTRAGEWKPVSRPTVMFVRVLGAATFRRFRLSAP